MTKVLFNEGDALSQTNLAEAQSRSNATDYVERGLGFTPDFNNDTLTINAGEAYIDDTGETYIVQVDQADIGLFEAATNYVFLTFDPDAADPEASVEYHVDTDDSAPTTPSLKVGTVDTSGDSSTELNRDPDGAFETLTVDGDSVGSGGSGAPTDATYVTTDDESSDLSNSSQHSTLSGGDLHDPANHDNAAHSAAFIDDGDGTTRQIWVVANGASDPAGASAEDIIFEEES